MPHLQESHWKTWWELFLPILREKCRNPPLLHSNRQPSWLHIKCSGRRDRLARLKPLGNESSRIQLALNGPTTLAPRFSPLQKHHNKDKNRTKTGQKINAQRMGNWKIKFYKHLKRNKEIHHDNESKNWWSMVIHLYKFDLWDNNYYLYIIKFIFQMIKR